MKLYLYEKCETCRKAIRWLDEKKIEYQAIPIRDKPPTKKELTAMLKISWRELKKTYSTPQVKTTGTPNLKPDFPTSQKKK